MADAAKVNSKEVGLEIGLLLGKYFLRTEDLHYGFWPIGQAADISNFATAQQNHSQFIIDNIPEGVNTILDVGAGAGKFAQNLIDQNYQVDCVIPSKFLAQALREKLGDQSKVYPVKYEVMETDREWDLILFSESFCYVNMQKAFDNSWKFLKKGGYLLICDFFNIPLVQKSPMTGGHNIHKYRNIVKDSKFEIVKDIDITRETAPTYTILSQFIDQVAEPVTEISGRYLNSNYPRLMKFLTWKYRHKLAKLKRKYLSGSLTAESFEKFKTYRLYLLKK